MKTKDQPKLFDVEQKHQTIHHAKSSKKNVLTRIVNIDDLGFNSVYKDFGNYIKNIRPNTV